MVLPITNVDTLLLSVSKVQVPVPPYVNVQMKLLVYLIRPSGHQQLTLSDVGDNAAE
jgi:hypothetical protein